MVCVCIHNTSPEGEGGGSMFSLFFFFFFLFFPFRRSSLFAAGYLLLLSVTFFPSLFLLPFAIRLNVFAMFKPKGVAEIFSTNFYLIPILYYFPKSFEKNFWWTATKSIISVFFWLFYPRGEKVLITFPCSQGFSRCSLYFSRKIDDQQHMLRSKQSNQVSRRIKGHGLFFILNRF